ncbi:MAG: O-antigen ligase family protein [Clostridia bacterium]|nr:O-antigen ligase family protein [Clostridia bacterium]
MTKKQDDLHILKTNKDSILFPYYFLCAFLICMVTNNHRALFISEYVIFLLLYIASSFAYWIYKKPCISDNKLCIALIGLFILMLFVTALNVETFDRGTFLSYVVWILTLLCVLIVPPNLKSVYALITSLIMGGVIISLFVIVQQKHYHYENTYRFTIQFMNNLDIDPNYLASFLYIALGFSLYVFQKKSLNLLGKLGAGLSSIVITLAIIMTGSRAAYVSTAILFIGVFLHQIMKRNPLGVLFVVMCCVLVFAIIYAKLPQELKNRFNIEQLNDQSNHTRLSLWGNAIETWLQRPFWGYGAGHTEDLIFIYTGYNGDAHNTYLTFLLHFGLFGCLILVYCFWSIVKPILKSKNIFLISFVIAFLFNNLIIANHLGASFWFPLIIWYSLLRAKNRMEI